MEGVLLHYLSPQGKLGSTGTLLEDVLDFLCVVAMERAKEMGSGVF